MTSTPISVSLEVNGQNYWHAVTPRETLADVLRDGLGLTGTHLGCEQGVCGACTVLVDGESVRSCLTLAVQVDGRRVETIEGLAAGAELGDIQTAFSECHGLQCGFCTPGFLNLTKELLDKQEQVDDADIEAALESALCRCTGYGGIRAAMKLAAERRGQYVGNNEGASR